MSPHFSGSLSVARSLRATRGGRPRPVSTLFLDNLFLPRRPAHLGTRAGPLTLLFQGRTPWVCACRALGLAQGLLWEMELQDDRGVPRLTDPGALVEVIASLTLWGMGFVLGPSVVGWA